MLLEYSVCLDSILCTFCFSSSLLPCACIDTFALSFAAAVVVAETFGCSSFPFCCCRCWATVLYLPFPLRPLTISGCPSCWLVSPALKVFFFVNSIERLSRVSNLAAFLTLPPPFFGLVSGSFLLPLLSYSHDTFYSSQLPWLLVHPLDIPSISTPFS